MQEVEHIARLARLSLTDQEKALFQQQLSAILDYASQLQALDTSDVPVIPSASSFHGQLRPDDEFPGLSLADLLRNAPELAENQFRIPPVFE